MNDGGSETFELVPGVAYRELVEAVMPHRTEESFRNSAFFHAHGAELDRLLLTPRVEASGDIGDGKGAGIVAAQVARVDGVDRVGGVRGVDRCDRADRADPDNAASPGAVSIRVLQWNIEKGRELEGIIRRLREDPWMCRADLLLLNEVDCGTARGGNADQARRLATALEMHHAWLPTYIECTKGTGADLAAEGENTLGLHGLAILSRGPITAARAVTLPSCHDYFDFHEKRFGGRRGLYALITAGDRRFVAATTHLEVRRTPRCRARQFAAFLRGLDESLGTWARDGLLGAEASRNSMSEESEVEAGIVPPCIPAVPPVGVILGGDWNTNTFRRGTLASSVVEFLRLVTTPSETLAAQLAAPFSREPLFALLTAEGFTVEPCNEAVPTVAQDLGSVEDLAALPASTARFVDRAFGLSGRVLRMRLDWIAVRGLQARGRPVTLPAAGPDGRALSDHAAIGIDLEAG
jgi:endonuclease/exonuclease/phosphatase family metal-dependent hydrolase